MPSRISYNVHAQFVQDTPRLKSHLQAVQPVSVLVMDGLGLANEIKALLPDCIVINRVYPDDDIHNRKSPTDWMNERAPQAQNGIWQYTTNESGFSPNLISWHIELCKLAIERNVPLVIANCSVGTPAPEDWAAGRELFELMNTRRDLFILGLHEYACGVITSGFLGGAPDNAGVAIGETGGVNLIPSNNWPQTAPSPMYHCGRVQFLVDYCNSIGIQPPRVILTEHGFDDVSDIKEWSETLIMTEPYTSIRGWRSIEDQWKAWYEAQGWTPQRAYFEQMKYADQVIYPNSPVEAQLLFCWARPDNSNWEQFDLSDASEFQDLLEYYAVNEQPPDSGNGGTEPPMTKIDLAPYFTGLPERYKYELGHTTGGTELLQTQGETPDMRIFRHVKQGGAAQFSKWERLCYTENYIWRDLDTSGDTEVYRLTEDGQPWSQWCPRFMAVGDTFRRSPKVTWYNKQTGVAIRSYDEVSDIRLVSILSTWKSFVSNVVINDVICLEYFHPGGQWIERYYYGKRYGLVGWESREWKSGVSVAQSPHPAPKPEQLGAWANPPPVPVDSTTPPPINVPFPPANDPAWEAATIAPVYTDGARVRTQPSTTATIAGTITEAEGGLIAPSKGHTASDGVWYPLRVNGDMLAGWSRNDVIQFALTPDPEPNPEPTTFTLQASFEVPAGTDVEALKAALRSIIKIEFD